MKKLLSVSALTLALTACGGGSSTDKTPDVKVDKKYRPDAFWLAHTLSQSA